ncbi:MAG: TonB-dependent receptor [Microscillaceae bacterium]|nr:TonB-dependent receptor [Microscillaceae bacterium]MDW8460581.1 TonB-dependent receptor [Cytophagales bacterium]
MKSVFGYFNLLFWLCLSSEIFAQKSYLKGTVYADNQPLAHATIQLFPLQKIQITNTQGQYEFTHLPLGTYTLKVSLVGYQPITREIHIATEDTLTQNFYLQPDNLQLHQVVVTATRGEVPQYDAPVLVNTISKRTFETTQSLTLVEGLTFSPGLRIENNCQNCGFTQVRMNGLAGAYSQILINNRPIFSALASVYGLEMLPTAMIDRIEVVRGAGSVLYGGNAIAGTLNILTKEPIENGFEVAANHAFTNLQTPDFTLQANASLVSQDLEKGITFYTYHRNRTPWDANQDGFSELTKLQNYTFGMEAFWNTSSRSKWKTGLFYINEFRRGGSDFDRLPHQAQIAEQLKHHIYSTNISYEWLSKNLKHKISPYISAQWIHRDSYYGSGGRILLPNEPLTQSDSLALNAYGQSKDLSATLGGQYNFAISNKINLTAGTEYLLSQVKDEMLGYQRQIRQSVNTWGNYAQIELKPIPQLTWLLGSRVDWLNLNGTYQLIDQQHQDKLSLLVFVPRLSVMYSLHKNWKLRASWAKGYRAPQAFNEDLHTETVGGAAKFIQLAPNLNPETSQTTMFSVNHSSFEGNLQYNFIAEGFYTYLRNPFILTQPFELPNGVSVITKRNGEGAVVKGINLEWNMAYNRTWLWQMALTAQTARYVQPEIIWQSIDNQDNRQPTITQNLLRTPNLYGYVQTTYNLNKQISLSYSGVWTGQMQVPHMIEPETEYTILKTTPTFFEHNLKLNTTWKVGKHQQLQIATGIQNALNSFQRDFDVGIQRDASYIYGPVRPRTFFVSVKYGMQ